MFLNFKIYVVCLFLCLTALKTKAQSVGGSASGAQTYCDTLNSGFLSISGYTGTVTTWQYSTNGGTNWFNNGNSFATQSYFNLKQSTCYRAIVQNGSFPPDTSTIACITIYLPTVAGTITGGGNFCGSSGPGNLNLIGHTGNILKWEKSINVGSSWNPIANTTATLSYSNITQNTLYRALVQNSTYCLEDTSSVAGFTINPLTVAGSINSIGTTTVCYASGSNTLNLSGNVGAITKWISSTDNGASWNLISNTTNTLLTYGLIQTTIYGAIVQSANCSIDTTTYITINVLPKNIINAGADTTISQGQSVTLNGSGSGTPLWLPVNSGLNDPGVLNPISMPINTTNYILTITDINSCVTSDTVLVTVLPLTFEGVITTVFTPNGDGINDNWYIENINYYPENEVTVYNIYGNIVYSKKGYTNDWQGTYNGAPLPDGTYFYVVKAGSNTQTVLKGSLDILRNK